MERVVCYRHRKGVEFKVYYKNYTSYSMASLGKVIERRNKERRNNLRDLSIKARREFSDQVKDPSLIFLLGS